MNKLTALIEAAKAAKAWNYFDVQEGNGEEVFDPFHDLANPATILELCALLEKAEKALKAQVEDKRDGPFFHEDEHPKGSCLRNSEEAIAAIKQWKEQT